MKHFTKLQERWHQSDRLQRIGFGVVVVATALVLVAFVFKKVSYAMEQQQRAKDLALGPRVLIAPVTPSAPEQTLTLLGEARPYQEVTLYAKVSGYLRDVSADKGDHVKAGQRLGRIESPETDQQYAGAQAEAQNKKAIAERYRPLLERKLVSQQEADQAFSDAHVAQANLESLGAIKGYQELRAPFDGVVTARYADPGALVQNANASQSSAQAIYTVSQTDHLRIYVYVNQKYAAAIRNGLPVLITLPERPDLKVEGTVTRYSGALDVKTRMLLVEVDIDNPQNRIVAGSYVQVAMKVPSPIYLEVPVEALVQRSTQTYVSLVTPEKTVTYRPVSVADNDGQRVKVLSGVSAGQEVALNVGNTLEEGSRVQPVRPAPLK